MEKRFIRIGEKTNLDGVDVECTSTFDDERSSCPLCLMNKECATFKKKGKLIIESKKYESICFGKYRKDKKSVYFIKPLKYSHDDIHS